MHNLLITTVIIFASATADTPKEVVEQSHSSTLVPAKDCVSYGEGFQKYTGVVLKAKYPEEGFEFGLTYLCLSNDAKSPAHKKDIGA